MDIGTSYELLDILAIDIQACQLTVIELKPAPSTTALAQAKRYAMILEQQDSETRPFFTQLGAAMAQLYGCDDLPAELVPEQVRVLAAWPAVSGSERFKVVGDGVL
jgi:hypothetical protein